MTVTLLQSAYAVGSARSPLTACEAGASFLPGGKADRTDIDELDEIVQKYCREHQRKTESPLPATGERREGEDDRDKREMLHSLASHSLVSRLPSFVVVVVTFGLIDYEFPRCQAWDSALSAK
ncbi:hypothetical protein R1flu_020129 [Riccia fluitans]|uniref:Uncharacterized protein n=1 Tax=Riccia fluitans TaxID=41844 RepID=A0ABD1ZMB5_9MARC